MLKKLLILSIAVSAIIVHASTKQAELELVYQLFELQNMKTNIEQLVLTSIRGQMQENPQLSIYQDVITNFCRKYLQFDRFKKEIAEIYLRYYTVQEIKDLIAFYKTPTGQKTVRMTIPIMQETTLIIQKQLADHSNELVEAVKAKAAQQQKNLK